MSSLSKDDTYNSEHKIVKPTSNIKIGEQEGKKIIQTLMLYLPKQNTDNVVTLS